METATQFDLGGKIIMTIIVTWFILSSLGIVFLTPSIWRGEKRSVSLPSIGYSIGVNVRNYVPFAIFVFCVFFIGSVWMGLEIFVGVPAILRPLFILPIYLGILFLPITLFVNAFNRPKFLVPPPHRKKRGWVTRKSLGPVDETDEERSSSRKTADSSTSSSGWWDDSFKHTNPNTLEQDITHEDVQQWLENHPDRVDALMAGLRTHKTRLLHTDATERQYAVSDEWWFEIAVDLGCDVERTKQDLDAIAHTSAFRAYAEGIGWLPDVRGTRYKSTPLIVERSFHRSETDGSS